MVSWAPIAHAWLSDFFPARFRRALKRHGGPGPAQGARRPAQAGSTCHVTGGYGYFPRRMTRGKQPFAGGRPWVRSPRAANPRRYRERGPQLSVLTRHHRHHGKQHARRPSWPPAGGPSHPQAPAAGGHKPCNRVLWALPTAHEPREAPIRRGKALGATPSGREPAPLSRARATTVCSHPPSPPPQTTGRPTTQLATRGRTVPPADAGRLRGTSPVTGSGGRFPRRATRGERPQPVECGPSSRWRPVLVAAGSASAWPAGGPRGRHADRSDTGGNHRRCRSFLVGCPHVEQIARCRGSRPGDLPPRAPAP